MSKKDKVQNRIDILKSTLNTLMITFFSICGYIFIRLEKASFLEFSICIVCAIGIASSWVLVLLYFNKYNDEIENL